jgi:hypothetical protein
VLLRQKW